MAGKHRKRSPASPAIREMQIKTTVRYDFTRTRMPVIKRQTAAKVGKEAESLGPSPSAGGRRSHFRNRRGGSSNSETHSHHSPRNATPECAPKRNEKTRHTTRPYRNVRSNVIHKSQTAGTARRSTSGE